MKMRNENIIAIHDLKYKIESETMAYVTICDPAVGHDCIEIWYGIDSLAGKEDPDERYYFNYSNNIDKLLEKLESLYEKLLKEKPLEQMATPPSEATPCVMAMERSIA